MNKDKKNPKDKLLLVILDGWGEASLDELNNPHTNQYNAIYQAKTPFFDELELNQKKTLIDASSKPVGLPDEQMGNSEVGHLNLGAGRVVYQDIVRINEAIKSGEFHKNSLLNQSLNNLAIHQKALHIIGLCSDGGIHSHQDHLLALFSLACEKSINKIYFHLILDGRDVSPRSAEKSIQLFEKEIKEKNQGMIASIVGRFYAMDRDSRWERIQKAYKLFTKGKAVEEYYYKDAISALNAAYHRGEDDEFVKPSSINNYQGIEENDLLIFMNFRADRARQLTQTFVDSDFKEFERDDVILQDFITLTEYQENLNAKVLFPSMELKNTLGEVLETKRKKQLRIAETEKYAHVTYFFSGGREHLFEGETRKMIPSPKVKTYDLQPEMSAKELCENLIQAINSDQYDFIVCNFANPDMVGHTGNLKAAIKAIETIDGLMAEIASTCKKQNIQLLITADHGNAEKMFDNQTNQPHTAHTLNPVPLYYLGNSSVKLKERGKLSNIAPTVLDLINIEKPLEMTEKSLVINQ